MGPYPGVTLFEAANRIMTDLVTLHGVAWLLKNKVFPFDSYAVGFGNENDLGFNIRAGGVDGETLVGEVSNVARHSSRPRDSRCPTSIFPKVSRLWPPGRLW